MNSNGAMIEEPPKEVKAGRDTHLLFLLCVGACLAFFGWAYVSTLDIVSLASGEVIPSSQVKSVQHLEGGIVREIAIREGEQVKKGQKLIVLEPTQSGADVGEIQVRLLSLRAEIARLEAEVSDAKTPVFDDDLMANNPRMVQQTLVRFSSRKKAKQSRIASQEQTIAQRRQEIKEIGARIRNQNRSLKLMEEQIAISEDLLKEDLTNRYNHLDLLKEASNIKGRKEEDTAALQRAKSALKEAQANMEGIHTAFLEEAGKELEDARLNFNELSQREQKFEDNLARTVLRSPVDGVIKTLHVTTVGGVLRPGQTVIDVVPADDRLIIEAKLPTQDIGYVQAGQSALIKLTSADAMRFGGMDGIVTNVSPDTLVTEQGSPYYKVRIETASDRFQHGDLQYRLFPGMQVIASIRTGERTVLEYLGDPFLNTMSGAMGER
jgi:membrane fusion protein, adhesin transport system